MAGPQLNGGGERAFSQALQCVKYAIRHDLLVRAPAPSLVLEAESRDDLLIDDEDEEALGNQWGWT
ncbi:hypothetical protein BJV78DRAFT_1244230 [Lactifluus subvellereus]|nr:hypothetical protein BJV78DRAFT_1244230 [Lactifluus subvellereus]